MSAQKKRTTVETEGAEWSPTGYDAQAPAARRTYAPLIVGGVVAAALIVVLLFNLFRPQATLTIADLQSPAVGALGAGSELYPANSEEGLREIIKFGYLPAVDVSQLADGTLVLGTAEAAQDSADRGEFLAADIPPAQGREGFGSGSPITWEDALDDYGYATVFMPELADAGLLGQLLEEASEHISTDSLILRSADTALLQAAAAAGIAGMYTGAVASTTPEELGTIGITMAAVAADDPALSDWIASGLQIWVTGLESEGALNAAAESGAFGALSANPFTIQPSSVKNS